MSIFNQTKCSMIKPTVQDWLSSTKKWVFVGKKSFLLFPLFNSVKIFHMKKKISSNPFNHNVLDDLMRKENYGFLLSIWI